MTDSFRPIIWSDCLVHDDPMWTMSISSSTADRDNTQMMIVGHVYKTLNWPLNVTWPPALYLVADPPPQFKVAVLKWKNISLQDMFGVTTEFK